MRSQCYPITVLPHTSQLFRDYLGAHDNAPEVLGQSYPLHPQSSDWQQTPSHLTLAQHQHLAGLLATQNQNPSPATQHHLDLLRNGASAVVTGQQVGLFGGPLLTLLKAATAIRRARQATAAGYPTVPLFWLATEDHDLAEINQSILLTKTSAETLSLDLTSSGQPVGNIPLPDQITQLAEYASDLLAWAPITELLREAYTPGQTLASASAKLISGIFREQGLIVLDASTRDLHALGVETLEAAITNAESLEAALITRSNALVAAGYHAQVLVVENHSLLFLLDEQTGTRHPLRRKGNEWKAGQQTLSTEDLLTIARTTPERLSPNALLRPIFQDTILPTSAYIGGPAEIAYFAQSQVLYQSILDRTTPILPRLTATLIEPAIATVMAQHELSLNDAFQPLDNLAQKLAARAIPIEGKKKISNAGNALNAELDTLLAWMHQQNPELGRAGDVSASKMRYQMNRLRRLTANFELQRTASLRKHATAISLSLYPNEHPQERALSSLWFLARGPEDLPEQLVEQAAQECTGHKALYL